MKKMISVLVLGSVLSFTALQAQVHANNVQNIIETHKVASISNDDMNMLFNDVKSGDVVALSNVEMSETKGEGILAGLLVSFLTPVVVKAGEWFANKLF
ncbi:hypothetical protein [Helicobacter bilis]|uniref:Uncharacterized protein n=1 Tax=Helicobacter bilis TaxID=37372 RepID=A0A4U8UB71_9HELI|nr:hypothetical protein [Helicobacter bilis]MCI7410522.1 hypothetical protein [Helicobacter bilis]MDD7297418.1 hypothetical protein [Helicobacter bilis]MDY4401003.1 hypothetical protein [Helicobacter bilis]TLE09591.1 hypothetical protein LS78_001860 [Helicobacter bilis]TLE12216.1 hypothetical protein LS79_000430 [Helicobacter bilis]